MDRISPIKYVEDVKLAFSDVEIDKLRFSCGDNKRTRAIIETLLSSGVRVSELCSMEIQDVNFATNEIIVREGKGGKQRKTYINSVCAEHLRIYLNSRKESGCYLFLDRFGNQLTVNAIEQIINRLQKKSGVTNVHPHRFRRTFASSMAKKGMDIRTIQILMGHSNINTTMLYISLCDDHIHNEYKRFA